MPPSSVGRADNETSLVSLNRTPTSLSPYNGGLEKEEEEDFKRVDL